MGVCDSIGHLCRLLIVGATGIALVLQLFTAASCELVDYGAQGGQTFGFFFAGYNGKCQDSVYDTDDDAILAGRTMVVVSIIAGAIAGGMVLLEWLFCSICCAGLLEGLAYFLAWAAGAASFAFYGSDLCSDGGGETFDFAWVNLEVTAGDSSRCTFHSASGMMTAAIVLYFICTFALCLTPQPSPLCSKK